MRNLLLAGVAVCALGTCKLDAKADDAERQRTREMVYADCVAGAMEWRQSYQAPEAPPPIDAFFGDVAAFRAAQVKYNRLKGEYDAQRQRYADDEKSFIAHVCPIIRNGGDYPVNTPFPAETRLHMRARDNVTTDAPFRAIYVQQEQAKANPDDKPAIGIMAIARSIALSRARALDACTRREIAKQLGLKSVEDVPLDAGKIGYLSGLVNGVIDAAYSYLQTYGKACPNEQIYIDAQRELKREYPDY